MNILLALVYNKKVSSGLSFYQFFCFHVFMLSMELIFTFFEKKNSKVLKNAAKYSTTFSKPIFKFYSIKSHIVACGSSFKKFAQSMRLIKLLVACSRAKPRPQLSEMNQIKHFWDEQSFRPESFQGKYC